MSYLHDFLAQGFTDTLDQEILETLTGTLGSVTTTGFVAPVDERLSMELTGFLDMIDLSWTVKRSAFPTLPAMNSELTHAGATYRLRFMKPDESAILLGFKKIST